MDGWKDGRRKRKNGKEGETEEVRKNDRVGQK
jgi:hypothetical protein